MISKSKISSKSKILTEAKRLKKNMEKRCSKEAIRELLKEMTKKSAYVGSLFLGLDGSNASTRTNAEDQIGTILNALDLIPKKFKTSRIKILLVRNVEEL